MNSTFLIHPSSFILGVSRLCQSILQKAFTGELATTPVSD